MTIDLGPLHPRHGPHEPTSSTPARTPGSLRRTATTDMLRPEGLSGPLVLRGRARDLHTAVDGSARVLGESSTYAVVDFVEGRRLRAVTTVPHRPALSSLLGRSVSGGFRSAVLEADPRLPEDHSLLNLLLDDFPVATLVSGHAFVSGSPAQRRLPVTTGRMSHGRDQCAGFADGGTVMNGVDREGAAPLVTGPAAPALLDPDDPLGWHATDRLPPDGMRRSRRMDIRPGSPTVVDVLFRDSHVRPDGLEIIVHEYTVEVHIEPETATVLSCTANPRVLPWVECPAAVASATRLAGRPVAGVRRHIRATFGGVSTCTHLNDTLRSLEDVAALLPLLRSVGAPPTGS
ncbi:MAG TPA: DUF2889 domain-containing protein [Blastococcus sp.]|nr:DUF2889 domain-containing protein [Blastococcus sp.]